MTFESKTFQDDNNETDSVEVTLPEGYETEVWIWVREDGHRSMVMLEPDTAFALADAIVEAATDAASLRLREGMRAAAAAGVFDAEDGPRNDEEF